MPLAVMVSSGCSFAAYFTTRGTVMEDTFWLASGGLMIALMPYTIAFLAPINGEFIISKDENFADDDRKWSGLLSDWLTFHTPRAVISFTLFSVGVYKLACGK